MESGQADGSTKSMKKTAKEPRQDRIKREKNHKKTAKRREKTRVAKEGHKVVHQVAS